MRDEQGHAYNNQMGRAQIWSCYLASGGLFFLNGYKERIKDRFQLIGKFLSFSMILWVWHIIWGMVPHDVLGGGVYSQLLIRSPRLREYDMVDCVADFLRITKDMMTTAKPKLTVGTHHSDFMSAAPRLPDARYDLILSSGFLHHVPDRIEHAQAFWRLLKPGGAAVCSEMTHYVPRLRILLSLYSKLLWAERSWYEGPGVPCTHHGLTLKELKHIAEESQLHLEFISWNSRNEGVTWRRWASSTVDFVYRKPLLS